MRARPDRSLGSVLQPEVNGLYVHLHRRFGDHQRDLKKEPGKVSPKIEDPTALKK